MLQQLTGREKTALLKAFAILAVLINHYLNRHVTPEYAGYANGIIGLFFVLSGYGLSFSLSEMKTMDKGCLKFFYQKRFLRIYPLFWLALLFAALFNRKIYSIATITAFPLHKASGIYWFISSLLQCYLIAPFLYQLLKKIELKQFLRIIFFVAAGLQVLYFTFGLPFNSDYFVYRDFFLGHLLLFTMGLCLSDLLKQSPGQPRYNKPLWALAFVFFGGAVWATRPESHITAQDALIIAPFFITACSFLVYLTLRTSLILPGKKLLILIGDKSYSLYLFHLFYFSLLDKLGFLKNSILQNILWTLAFSPLLLLFCIFIESWANRLANILKAKWSAGHYNAFS